MELVEIMGVMGKDWMIQLPKENVIKLKEGDELCLPYFVYHNHLQFYPFPCKTDNSVYFRFGFQDNLWHFLHRQSVF